MNETDRVQNASLPIQFLVMKILFSILFFALSFTSFAQCNIELGIPAEYELVQKTDTSMAFMNEEEAVFVFLKSKVPNEYDFKFEADSTVEMMRSQPYYSDIVSETKELNGREYRIVRTVVNDPKLKDVNDYFNLGFIQVCEFVYSFTFMAANKNTILHDATFERILSKTDFVD